MALFHQLLVFAMAISTITACKAKAFSKGADAINYFFAQLGVDPTVGYAVLVIGLICALALTPAACFKRKDSSRRIYQVLTEYAV